MAIPKFVVCLVLMGTFQLSDAEIKMLVCEHQDLAIDCDEGEIKILSALYGRNNTEDCFHQETIGTFVNDYGSMCASDVSLEVVKTRCENKTSCSVAAENSVFHDPCPYVFKYLEVEYSCDGVPTETPPSLPSNASPECPRSVLKVEGITLTFPAAGVGEQINSVEICLDGSFDSNSSLGTRLCGEDSRWEKAELTNCYNSSTLEDSLKQLALTNITEQNVNEAAVNLAVASSVVDSITPEGLELIIAALASVVEVGTTSRQVTDSVVEVVDNVMALDEETLVATAVSGVVLSLESQVALFHQNEQNYTEYGSYLEVSAWQLEKESLVEGFTVNSQYPGNIVNNSDEADILTGSSIRFPPSVIDIISKVHPNINLFPLTFITYVDARLFQQIEEFNTSQLTNTSILSSYVDSQVITANVELDDVSIKDLPQNSSVLINFPIPNVVPEVTKCNTTQELSCVFWEYNKTIGGGRWSQEGCTMLSSTDEEIVCSCNHLTSFAVLVRVHDSAVSKTFRVVFRVLTVVGCILSIVGLSISVLIILFIRKLRGSQTFRVHVNLCFALIAFYVTFLIGIDRTDNPLECKIIASFIHFFCLSSMAWMSVEAVLFYHLVFKLTQGDVKNLLPVGMAFAWGTPMLVTMAVAFLDQSHDYECFPDYCFLHPGFGMYIGFLLLIGLMSVFNTILFSMIICKFCCRKIMTTDEEKKRKEIVGRVKGIVLFWFLLGMSWIFGLVSVIPIDPVKIIFDILFSVFMALQGFAMFYLLVFNNPEIKKLLNRLNCFGEDIFSFSRYRSTRKTTQVSPKSDSIN